MARAVYELVAQQDAKTDAETDVELGESAGGTSLKERHAARSSLETIGLDRPTEGRPGSVALSKAPPQQCSPCGAARILGSCMMFLVVGLVLLSYVPMMHFYADGSATGSIVLLIFHVLIVLTLVSYFQTALTDPGTVPLGWHARVAKMEHPPYRKCGRCGYFKPPRSHFDSVTRRLVLNMDHYCPWVNNCVGFFNRKFFIQFVGYAFVTCFFASLALYLVIRDDSVPGLRIHSGVIKSTSFNKKDGRMSPGGSGIGDDDKSAILDMLGLGSFGLSMMTLLGAIIDGVFTFSLSIFFSAHMWLTFRNQTTIEGNYASRPYRLSRGENFRQVFGAKPLYWFLPLYGDGPVGDGVHWPRADGTWDGLTEEVDSPATAGMGPGVQVV
ncbi:Palmitoyltransferase [Hondaea fermentalgiana]|uniref:Palmitoyltransferase n=1 Tax=Hondaea fermentalgiana TaxID=2315210 RepID=A0A2R5GLX4_9STRA|nr:Palmitoyltransferase [Hondaea fermentalgiana]|eukprot:GBG30738.1 Palmitoyltransferase [Hondaea fermentalgiana]